MNFLSPLSLILFIPLGGAVVVLYLLKLRRKERVVSSTMLWQDAVADLQADAPFQKLKKSLLLLLQIVALALLVFAVARPYVRAKGISENRIVVILDSSASMQACDMKPSRFGWAKNKALEVVNKMGPRDSMLVMTASTKTRVVQSFTSDKKTLSSAISRLAPTDAPCNMRQALVLALSLVAGRSTAPPSLVIFSDGKFGSLSDLPVGGARLDFVKVGSDSDNVAITGLDSRKNLSGTQQVFIGLKNFSRRERGFNLEIYVNDKLYDIREESLTPGQIKQEMLEDLQGVGGRVTAKLDIDDQLAADNSGSVYLAKPRKIDVLLVSKGNVFIENALNLDPRTRLTRADAVPAGISKQDYDVVVFDRIAPPAKLPAGGYLLIGTSAAQGPAEVLGKASRPAVVDSDLHHPVTAYVDFSGIRLAEAEYLKPKPWGTALVEGERGPMVCAGSMGGRSFVQMSFDLLKSDFPLHVGFPIFIANCLDWLAPSGEGGGSEGARTGQPAYIDVPASCRKIAIIDPGGEKQSINVTQTPVVYSDTERAGVYHVMGKDFSREFACNLASPAESDTAPREVVSVGGRQLASRGKAVETNREMYWPLILLALAVLSFEWYAYHRRL
ncbi:MAG: BatA and WFA domain-containing protein [Armatimonadota bacterium]|nr:BatA and WFA domain-containing protein [bacterium]